MNLNNNGRYNGASKSCRHLASRPTASRRILFLPPLLSLSLSEPLAPISWREQAQNSSKVQRERPLLAPVPLSCRSTSREKARATIGEQGVSLTTQANLKDLTYVPITRSWLWQSRRRDSATWWDKLRWRDPGAERRAKGTYNPTSTTVGTIFFGYCLTRTRAWQRSVYRRDPMDCLERLGRLVILSPRTFRYSVPEVFSKNATRLRSYEIFVLSKEVRAPSTIFTKLFWHGTLVLKHKSILSWHRCWIPVWYVTRLVYVFFSIVYSRADIYVLQRNRFEKEVDESTNLLAVKEFSRKQCDKNRKSR